VAAKQSPPQDELEFELYEDKHPESPILAHPADITSRWFFDNVYEVGDKALRVTLDSPFGIDVLYQEAEFADPLTREGFLFGAVDDDDKWRSLHITDDGRLKVDAEISLSTAELDVELSALDGDNVGIFGYVDGNINNPIPLNLTSNGEIKVVSVLSPDTGLVYDEGIFAAGPEHVVTTYSIPSVSKFSLLSVKATGRSNAIFRLKINSTTIELKRNSWSDRNIEFEYSRGLSLNIGDVIALTIQHNELTSIPFNATIYWEEE